MYLSKRGLKTRSFDAIVSELQAFFDVHAELGRHPGGIHVDMTGEDVAGCAGGTLAATFTSGGLATEEEDERSPCNGGNGLRLNGAQSTELAFVVAQRMRDRLGLPPLVS